MVTTYEQPFQFSPVYIWFQLISGKEHKTSFSEKLDNPQFQWYGQTISVSWKAGRKNIIYAIFCII